MRLKMKKRIKNKLKKQQYRLMLIINKHIFDKNKIKRLIVFYFRILVINFLCFSQSFLLKTAINL